MANLPTVVEHSKEVPNVDQMQPSMLSNDVSSQTAGDLNFQKRTNSISVFQNGNPKEMSSKSKRDPSDSELKIGRCLV